MESSQATPDPEFEQWVHERLAQWPTMLVYQLERWLQERDAHEFLPPVHATLRRRGIGPHVAITAMRPTAP